ncbi:MAG: FMN-binding protein [Clostridia bacterium]|nr:FMN-binding protein [Clostridia bacterium]
MEKLKNNSVLSAAVIGLKLLLICAIIAGIVSFVYALTADIYAENIKQTKELSVGKIFTGKDETRLQYTEIGSSDGATVSAVYEGDVLLGYCVEIKTAGFGGEIELMIGYKADHSIYGVDVVSHTETPGLGSKSADEKYLKNNYSGKSGVLVAGTDVDMIAGASVTSGAVLDGVNRATAALENILNEGGVDGE